MIEFIQKVRRHATFLESKVCVSLRMSGAVVQWKKAGISNSISAIAAYYESILESLLQSNRNLIADNIRLKDKCRVLSLAHSSIFSRYSPSKEYKLSKFKPSLDAILSDSSGDDDLIPSSLVARYPSSRPVVSIPNKPTAPAISIPTQSKPSLLKFRTPTLSSVSLLSTSASSGISMNSSITSPQTPLTEVCSKLERFGKSDYFSCLPPVLKIDKEVQVGEESINRECSIYFGQNDLNCYKYTDSDDILYHNNDVSQIIHDEKYYKQILMENEGVHTPIPTKYTKKTTKRVINQRVVSQSQISSCSPDQFHEESSNLKIIPPPALPQRISTSPSSPISSTSFCSLPSSRSSSSEGDDDRSGGIRARPRPFRPAGYFQSKYNPPLNAKLRRPPGPVDRSVAGDVTFEQAARVGRSKLLGK